MRSSSDAGGGSVRSVSILKDMARIRRVRASAKDVETDGFVREPRVSCASAAASARCRGDIERGDMPGMLIEEAGRCFSGGMRIEPSSPVVGSFGGPGMAKFLCVTTMRRGESDGSCSAGSRRGDIGDAA